MSKFCTTCGKEIADAAVVCPGCGVQVAGANLATGTGAQKSKICAALLAFFLGGLGIHNFYLGYTGKAVAQLLLTIFGSILAVFIIGFFMVAAVGIWTLVEFIMILTGSINTDAQGNPIV